jgi:hypothetical protein
MLLDPSRANKEKVFIKTKILFQVWKGYVKSLGKNFDGLICY